MKNQVVILDFGGQYTQLIARRVREEKVYCQVISGDATIDEIRSAVDPLNGELPGAIILSGGPDSVDFDGAVLPDMGVFKMGCPVFGICYGMQAMAKMLGGRIITGKEGGGREYGPADFKPSSNKGLFAGIEGPIEVWMSHGDSVEKVPPGFSNLGSTEKTPIAAMGNDDTRMYGVQFHPEVYHSEKGQEILRNFLFDICHLEPDWTMGRFVDETVAEISARVGDANVISAVSGGVDSTVASALVHRAVGDRLHCIMVDHGLLRKNEVSYVVKSLASLGIKVNVVDAADRFLDRLKGVVDPEVKRKIIGEEFIRVFEEEARKYGESEYMVQGTIYPDIIESGSRLRQTIKSHHNVGGLPERMSLKIVEPLRELFKDEVRLVGKELGLPQEFLERQPFPGPGLAVRILGEVTPQKVHIVREAHAVLDEEMSKSKLCNELWQSFCVLPNVRTVGVMGDKRTYGHVIAIRAVTSEDAMTADWARLPYEVLERVSTRLVNEVPEVTRVVLDITSKPPSTIEWE